MADRAAFVTEMLPYAEEASAATGVDPLVILSQAAHESAWGAHAPGNNFFGIKGHGQTFATHEVVNGQSVATKASFRKYDSPAQSFLDWAKLIATKPRYAAVVAAKTSEEQIAALGKSGYATDPHYASKLSAVANQISSHLPHDNSLEARDARYAANIPPMPHLRPAPFGADAILAAVQSGDKSALDAATANVRQNIITASSTAGGTAEQSRQKLEAATAAVKSWLATNGMDATGTALQAKASDAGAMIGKSASDAGKSIASVFGGLFGGGAKPAVQSLQHPVSAPPAPHVASPDTWMVADSGPNSWGVMPDVTLGALKPSIKPAPAPLAHPVSAPAVKSLPHPVSTASSVAGAFNVASSLPHPISQPIVQSLPHPISKPSVQPLQHPISKPAVMSPVAKVFDQPSYYDMASGSPPAYTASGPGAMSQQDPWVGISQSAPAPVVKPAPVKLAPAPVKQVAPVSVMRNVDGQGKTVTVQNGIATNSAGKTIRLS